MSAPADEDLQDAPIKVTVVGDGVVGKTCMLITYTTNVFPLDYIATVFDNYSGNILVDGQSYYLTLFDTAGQEQFSRLRPLSYNDTGCFLICYAIDDRDSFENVVTSWIPEIRDYCKTAPIVIVATKIDLRNTEKEQSKDLITTEEGWNLVKAVKAYSFVECSAKEMLNLHEVFAKAVKATKVPPPRRKRTCHLL